jgi:predicted small metal-binding protein
MRYWRWQVLNCKKCEFKIRLRGHSDREMGRAMNRMVNHNKSEHGLNVPPSPALESFKKITREENPQKVES